MRFARGVLLGGDLLPPVALVTPRRLAAVNTRHHLNVGVPKLPRYQLVPRAGSDCTNRVEVPLGRIEGTIGARRETTRAC
jgi:hypothetical protein